MPVAPKRRTQPTSRRARRAWKVSERGDGGGSEDEAASGASWAPFLCEVRIRSAPNARSNGVSLPAAVSPRLVLGEPDVAEQDRGRDPRTDEAADVGLDDVHAAE